MIVAVGLFTLSMSKTADKLLELEKDDFKKIFSFMHNLRDVNLRFAGQMKDDVLEYMVEHNPQIEHLQLGAPNLITNKGWRKLFETRGANLKSLKLSELNDSLDDATVALMSQKAVNLRRLKLKRCSHMTSNSFEDLKSLHKLTHLSLLPLHDVAAESISSLISGLGHNLQTLSLERFVDADDTLLSAIHTHCHSLAKLRITQNAAISDAAFAALFTDWENPPLPFVDLSSNRDVDNGNPDGPEDDPIGFASEGFKALMKHSGKKLERLNISSCRHISREAFEEVFDGRKRYPQLRDLDVSFVTHVDDYLAGLLFKSCPALVKLAVFACFKVKDVRIPKGVAVLGLPNAQDSVVIEGDFIDEL